MSNQSVTKRISALREEAANIYGKRTNNESGRVQVVREWNPFGKASSQSIFSQGGGGRRNQ
jgi:hypothetical protein